MSNYSKTDFFEASEGLDYIFDYMSGVYGAKFTRYWEQVEPDLVRSVWQRALGKLLTYKPSLDYALSHLPPKMPPSASAFRKICNDGPTIPDKPALRFEKQDTQHEKARRLKNLD